MIREWLRRPHPYPPIPVDPGPTPGERLASLREQLAAIDQKLSVLNREMRDFRGEHALITDRFNRVLRMHAKHVTDRESVENAWRVMLKRSDALFFERNRILREFAALKLEAK